MDLGHDVGAVDDDRGAAWRAKGDVQDGPVFGHIDPGSAEHRIDALAQAGGFGKPAEEHYRLVGDTILGVIEKNASAFRSQPLAAGTVVVEQRAQVHSSDHFVMVCERLPFRTRRQWQ